MKKVIIVFTLFILMSGCSSTDTVPSITPTYSPSVVPGEIDHPDSSLAESCPSPVYNEVLVTNKTPEEFVAGFFAVATILSDDSDTIQSDFGNAKLENPYNDQREYTLKFDDVKIYMLVDEEGFVRYVEAVIDKSKNTADIYATALMATFEPVIPHDNTEIIEDLAKETIETEEASTLSEGHTFVSALDMNNYHYLTIANVDAYSSDPYYSDVDNISLALIMFTMDLME